MTDCKNPRCECCGMTDEELLERVRSDIQEYGCHIVWVFDDNNETSPFAYTVGLTEKGQPEVVVCGVPAELGAHICNEIYHKAVDEGLELTAGVTLDNLVEGFPGILCDVSSEHEANQARNYYRNDDVRVLQFVLPDLQGNYPWDLAYDLDPAIQKHWLIPPQEVEV